MIEESIVEFVDDISTSTKNKLLYELAEKATGSYKFPRDQGFILRKYDGVKKWSKKFELPDPDECVDHHNFMRNLKDFEEKGCEIEVEYDYDYGHHYLLIIGDKKKDVQKVAAEVVDAVRSHQSNCNCRPTW